ncbi:hypothetical protein BDZ94DRAFT_1230698 [Collybia nuda]|uniref:Uncharacterized protein n=1 Tax=Collybia nuda TaxID=64659 RepID=A0A9P5XQ63_9AGAR|nr:hypothetical protein BDZ94DRAFT_1230698 [Collybia nuda]
MELPHFSENVQQKLTVLERVAESLNIDDLSFPSYAASITRLSAEELSLRRSLNRLHLVEEELQVHLASMKSEQQLIDKWRAEMEREGYGGETSEMLDRRREALLKKAKEYHKELDSLLANMPAAPPVTVSKLTKQQEKNKLKEQELKTKRAKIKAFQGLPPNLDLARHELRNARDEQTKLIQLRERLLGRMAESVT